MTKPDELRELLEKASPVESWSQNRESVTIARAKQGLGGYYDCWMGTAANARLVVKTIRALPALLDAQAEAERFREALRVMVDEKVDYMTINKLGDPEAQHSVKRARQALAALEGIPGPSSTAASWSISSQFGQVKP